MNINDFWNRITVIGTYAPTDVFLIVEKNQYFYTLNEEHRKHRKSRRNYFDERSKRENPEKMIKY